MGRIMLTFLNEASKNYRLITIQFSDLYVCITYTREDSC